jgi:putative flippase GtrA
LVRLGRYYASASAAGAVQFAVSWITLHTIWRPIGWVIPAGSWGVAGMSVSIPRFVLAPRLALLTGVAVGMIINFLASHLWAFQDAEPSESQA